MTVTGTAPGGSPHQHGFRNWPKEAGEEGDNQTEHNKPRVKPNGTWLWGQMMQGCLWETELLAEQRGPGSDTSSLRGRGYATSSL